jgi:CRISPR-associated protein Cas5t
MMIHRVKISAWTASFRYPNLISGGQPTLEVPPLSTVLGLLNAAAGQYLQHKDLEIGYYCEYGGKVFDLETTYQIDSNANNKPTNNAKSNVVQREVLFDVQLWLYFKDETLAKLFKEPYYPLLLGRSGDLATVHQIESLEDLPEVSNGTKVKGQVIPIKESLLVGKIQALPRYFSNSFPRQNLGTEPFTIVPFNAVEQNSHLTCVRDMSIGKAGIDIFFHRFNFADYV